MGTFKQGLKTGSKGKGNTMMEDKGNGNKQDIFELLKQISQEREADAIQMAANQMYTLKNTFIIAGFSEEEAFKLVEGMFLSSIGGICK